MDNSQYLLPREYEMLAILLPDQGEDETKTAVDKVLSYITDENGTIDSVSTDSPWGRRRLAYTIRHEGVDYRDGHYALVYFTAMPNVLNEIERELKLDVNVIRYLLLTHDPHMGEKLDGSEVDGEGADGEESAEAPAEAVNTEPTTAAATEEATTETVAEEAPVEEAAADEAPAEEAVAEEAAAEEAPATETVAEEAPAEEEMAAEPAARKRSNKLPEDGEGTDWVAGDGTDNMPEGFPLKGNASSKIYHPEESPNYNNTIAEIYFANNEVAEAHGYRLPKVLEKAAAAAGNTAADAAEALKGGEEDADKE